MKPHAWRRKSLVLHKTSSIANPTECEHYGIAKYINDVLRHGAMSENEDLICRKAIRLNSRTHQLKQMYVRFMRRVDVLSDPIDMETEIRTYVPREPTPVEVLMMLMLNLPYRHNLDIDRTSSIIEDVFATFGYDASVAEQVSYMADDSDGVWSVTDLQLHGYLISKAMVKDGCQSPQMHIVGFKEYWRVNGAVTLNHSFTRVS